MKIILIILLFIIVGCSPIDSLNNAKRPIVVVSTDKDQLFSNNCIVFRDNNGKLFSLPLTGFYSLNVGDTIK